MADVKRPPAVARQARKLWISLTVESIPVGSPRPHHASFWQKSTSVRRSTQPSWCTWQSSEAFSV